VTKPNVSSETNLQINSDPIVRTESLVKSFGNVQVLRGISTEIRRGEVVAILGPSGCGKSTFLRCLNLLERPTDGRVYFKNQDITAPKTNVLEVRQKMAMVFQLFHLFPHMTVLKNVTYAPLKVKKISKSRADELGRSLLEKVGLGQKADVYPSQLSGGQKQRVAIARALAMEPEVILFDEPTSALDPEMVKEVLEVIRELAFTGITMAVVTHEMGFAREVANRILFLNEGYIAEDAPPREFFSNPRCDRAKQFLEKML
jgi:ABC-type polar amino acid transport system ATPase subunit